MTLSAKIERIISMHFIIKEVLANFFAKKNKFNWIQIFVGIISMLLLAFVLCFIYCSRCYRIDEISSDKFTEAYTACYTKGDRQQGIIILDEIIMKFRKTPTVYLAKLMKADILIELHAYDAALQVLFETIVDGKFNIIKPLASARIIYVYDLKKDYYNAILASKEFINKFPDHFLVKDVYLNLAEYYLISGSKNLAVKIFNEVLINFPTTREAEKAQNRLKNIR
jgi:tetratricopeptide (TPR) repeat protein